MSDAPKQRPFASPAGPETPLPTAPPAPDPTCPRFSDQPFPAYRFVPTLNPHPRLDPRGHSYGVPSPDITAEARALANDWRASQCFRYGVDLYNYAYWWEAHETWEPLWLAQPPDTPLRHALQGLIQVSAAHLKRHVGQPKGTRTLLTRARHNFDAARPAGEVLCGINLELWWHDHVAPYFADTAAGHAYPLLLPT